jgi:hypothetical protein
VEKHLRCSHRMQGLPPELPEVSQPEHLDIETSQPELITLENTEKFESIEEFEVVQT